MVSEKCPCSTFCFFPQEPNDVGLNTDGRIASQRVGYEVTHYRAGIGPLGGGHARAQKLANDRLSLCNSSAHRLLVNYILI